jgi:hypothetical protein
VRERREIICKPLHGLTGPKIRIWCTRKIFQNKELSGDSASAGGFWLTDDAGTIEEELLRMIVRLAAELLCKQWTVDSAAGWGSWFPHLKNKMWANHNYGWSSVGHLPSSR